MEKKLKISSTAYRVLLLLSKLNEDEYNVNDLNNIFLKNSYIARLFSKDVILKYISTLRCTGCDILKPTAANNYCYKLNKAPVQIDFSDNELKTLALLKKYAENLYQDRFTKNYCSFITKLKRYVPNDKIKIFENYCVYWNQKNDAVFTKFERYSELIKKIEQYIKERQKVEIKYKLPGDKQEKLVLTSLQSIKYELNDISVICYNFVPGQTQSIKINCIQDIKQLPSLSGVKQIFHPVMFKLKGRLAKSYRLYEDEKLTKSQEKPEEIIVTTYSCDIESLLKRLMKYEKNCEILYPKQVQNNMKNLIQTTLDNYK